MAKCYEVVTPEWDESWIGVEPPDPGREFLYVFARNAKRAKVLAVRALRRQKRAGWIGYESANPFAGDWQITPFVRLPEMTHEEWLAAEASQ